MSSMYLLTIRGSSMERRSFRIQVGTRCRESFSMASGSDLESASASDSSEDLDGAGVTGDTTGTDIAPCTTITPSSRTAVPLIAAASITPTLGAGLLAPGKPSAGAELGAAASTGGPGPTFGRGHAPGRSGGFSEAGNGR